MELEHNEYRRLERLLETQGRDDGEPGRDEPWGWAEWALFAALMVLTALTGLGLGSALWLIGRAL